MANCHFLHSTLLNIPSFRSFSSSVIQAFIKAKDKGLSTLTDSLTFAIDKKDFRTTHSIFSIIGYLQTPSAIQVLLQNLRIKKDSAFQWQILQALDISGYQSTLVTEKEDCDLLLRGAADYLDKLLKWNRQVINQKGYELLAATLKRQIQSAQKQIFLFLELLYPKKVIRDIAFYFKHSDIDKVSYAHEFLENILSKEHKSLLLPLFAQCHVDPVIQKPIPIPDAESLFKEILACPTYGITLSLKATILYLIARLQLKQMSQIAH